MPPNSAELLKRNAEYAINHIPPLLISDMIGGRGSPPNTVIDGRVMPQSIFGLNQAEALVFRTIAGHPQPALEAIAALDITANGALQEIMVLYHTDCGAQIFDVRRLRAEFVERDPSLSSQVEHMTFGAIGKDVGHVDLEDALRQDVEWLKRQPLLRREIVIKGYMYDMETGRVSQIV